MKAFGLGSTGENVSTVIGSNPNSVNITAYGVLDPATGNLFVTIINKEHFAGAQNATVTLSPGAAYNGGQVWAPLQTRGAVTATSRNTPGDAGLSAARHLAATMSATSPLPSMTFSTNVP